MSLQDRLWVVSRPAALGWHRAEAVSRQVALVEEAN